jgi:hypothetical protein
MCQLVKTTEFILYRYKIEVERSNISIALGYVVTDFHAESTLLELKPYAWYRCLL